MKTSIAGILAVLGLLGVRPDVAIAQAAAADACTALTGLQIPGLLLSLPTRGAVVEKATRMDKDRSGAAAPYCAVIARINPVDPKAPVIMLQANLPETWNDKALQFGGGGYNGRIPDTTGWSAHDLATGPTALARGYLTFSDDSGHQSLSANDGLFAENDEALANFGYMHIRKAHDVMVEIAKKRYGHAPRRVYFAGGSTGGREALTAALRWPEAYDGVIANYPTANFIGLRMENAAIARSIYQNNSAGWIAPALVARIAADALAACDALDGVADGIVSNMAACRAGSAERLRKWSCPNAQAPLCLMPVQVNTTIRVYHDGFTDTWQPKGSANGFMGYNILEGVEMELGDKPDFRLPLSEPDNAHAALRADEFLKHFVARDPNFDLMKFDVHEPGGLTPRLKLVAEQIGATSPDYARFAQKGGKVLLLQGADDALVSPYENIRRYQAIVDAMGAAAVRQFLRFYVVPGQGHGVGSFRANWSNVDALDAWVERGTAPPATPVAYDANPKTAGRSRPLCEYPKWPRYNGSGDVNAAASFTCVTGESAQVRVAEGQLRGQVLDGVAVFRAVPFAAPPVGALRFRPPQPAKPWSGVREAVDEGPACPQTAGGDPAAKRSTTEDCLYLNVFAPAGELSSKHPVMVWIHGGGWNGGFAGARQYDPSPLVREGGIVVVSIAYRLGPLGLLSTPALDADNGQPSGNYLIRDHLEALRWVRRNIAAFGGDPQNVTIAGESAGANSVLALVASPLSRGLFHKAIAQSGVDDAHTLPRARAQKSGEEIAGELGCAAGAGQGDCLRKLPLDAFLNVRRKLGIVQDPQLFPVDPYIAFRDGSFNRVPMIIGTNLHEGYLFASGAERTLGRPMNESEYVAQMKSTFGADAEAAMKAYPAGAAPSPAAAYGDAQTDVRFACYMDLARVDASKYTTVYGFEMNEPDPVQQQPRPKFTLANTAYHTSDLGYLFDFDTAPLTGEAAALGRKWRGYWIQFVRTGSPNGTGLPSWPQFKGPAGEVLNLSKAGGAGTDFATRHHCAPLQQSGLVAREWK